MASSFSSTQQTFEEISSIIAAGHGSQRYKSRRKCQDIDTIKTVVERLKASQKNPFKLR